MPVGGKAVEVTPQASMSWRLDMAAAIGEARRSDRLLLAYVAVNSAWCPLCAHLERRVFDRPESAAIEKVCVPVKILRDRDTTEEERTFFRRHRVSTTPTLLILTPDGAELHRQVGRLFPPSALGRAKGAPPTSLIGVEDLLHLIAESRARDSADRKRMAELVKRSDVPAYLELAEIHRSRALWSEALPLLERAAEEMPGAEVEAQVVDLLLELRRDDQAATRLQHMLDRAGGHARAPHWRLRLMDIHERVRTEPATETEIRAQEAILTTIVEEAGNVSLEAKGRLGLVELFHRADERERMAKELRWFDRGMSRQSPQRGLPADALLRLVMLQRTAGAKEAANASEEWLRRLHPNSNEYQHATHGASVIPGAAPAPRAEPGAARSQ